MKDLGIIMLEKNELYMGTIEYENNELNFVFDGKKLRLTFLNEKESKAEYSIFMTKTEDGGHSPQKKNWLFLI